MKKCFLVLVVLVSGLTTANSQNYTSSANGAWTTGSNWSGGSSPSLTNQGWGTINVNHNLSVTGDYNLPGGSINIAAGKTLDLTGNLTLGFGGGGNTINVSGTLNITGNVKLYANLKILPGGKVVANGNVTVVSSKYLTVGTNVAPPPYADLVVKQNLNSETSGDMVVERNGRVAVYGNLINSGSTGGTVFTVNNGGEVYIHGNINLTGNGGDKIVNNNSTSPYGLYVNGTTTNAGGGSITTANKGDKSTMENTNPDFFNWVVAQSESPLPVELLFFKAAGGSASIQLSWATASELNFDYFSIERSLDGIYFNEIDRVEGHGTTNERHNYTYEDTHPLSRKLYYRLKSVDFDGFEEYFTIASVDFKSSKSMTVYPNPVVDGNMTIQFNFTGDEAAVIVITDLAGREKMRSQLSSIESEISLSVSYDPGIYLVHFKTADFDSVARILIK